MLIDCDCCILFNVDKKGEKILKNWRRKEEQMNKNGFKIMKNKISILQKEEKKIKKEKLKKGEIKKIVLLLNILIKGEKLQKNKF
jgi:hypothetical protein